MNAPFLDPVACPCSSHELAVTKALLFRVAGSHRDGHVATPTFALKTVTGPLVSVEIDTTTVPVAPKTPLCRSNGLPAVSISDVLSMRIPPQIVEAVIASCWIWVMTCLGAHRSASRECEQNEGVNHSRNHTPVDDKAHHSIAVLIGVPHLAWGAEAPRPSVVAALSLGGPDAPVVARHVARKTRNLFSDVHSTIMPQTHGGSNTTDKEALWFSPACLVPKETGQEVFNFGEAKP